MKKEAITQITFINILPKEFNPLLEVQEYGLETEEGNKPLLHVLLDRHVLLITNFSN